MALSRRGAWDVTWQRLGELASSPRRAFVSILFVSNMSDGVATGCHPVHWTWFLWIHTFQPIRLDLAREARNEATWQTKPRESLSVWLIQAWHWLRLSNSWPLALVVIFFCLRSEGFYESNIIILEEFEFQIFQNPKNLQRIRMINGVLKSWKWLSYRISQRKNLLLCYDSDVTQHCSCTLLVHTLP